MEPASPTFDQLVAIPGGLAWLLCYVLILRRAALDRAPGMPLVALAANISWEFIFGFLDPDDPPMDTINQVWFFVDVALVWQALRYGRAEFEARWPRGSYLPMVALCLALAFGMVLGVHREFGDDDGRYTAWGGNLLMSALFIQMLLQRGSSAGQSVWIALSKLVGTACFDLAQFTKTPSWPVEGGLGPLMTVMYLGCLVLDALYLWLLVRQLRREGRSPWRRI